MMPYRSSKTYGHDVGLSVCFRQWRAQSHCNQLHGYALAIHLEFEAAELDYRNWVIDFGSLAEVKETLRTMFDHTLLVAADDPNVDQLMQLGQFGIATVVVVSNVGCEAFAELVYGAVDHWLESSGHKPRVKLVCVDVREHGANQASYLPG